MKYLNNIKIIVASIISISLTSIGYGAGSCNELTGGSWSASIDSISLGSSISGLPIYSPDNGSVTGYTLSVVNGGGSLTQVATTSSVSPVTWSSNPSFSAAGTSYALTVQWTDGGDSCNTAARLDFDAVCSVEGSWSVGDSVGYVEIPAGSSISALPTFSPSSGSVTGNNAGSIDMNDIDNYTYTVTVNTGSCTASVSIKIGIICPTNSGSWNKEDVTIPYGSELSEYPVWSLD